MDKAALTARIQKLLEQTWSRDQQEILVPAIMHGTTTVLEAVYGPESAQAEQLQAQIIRINSNKTMIMHHGREIHSAAKGVLAATLADIEAGVLTTVTRTVTGEVISDLLQMATHEMDERGENAKDVAAVLVAAAFEDTIRRMGEAFCGITTRPPLSEVVIALKDNKVLVGSLVGTVQSQLQFRNHALHAEWNKIDFVSVRTVLGLVQELLLKHFS